MKYKIENISDSSFCTLEGYTQFEIAKQLCKIANNLAEINKLDLVEDKAIELVSCHLNGDYQSQCHKIGQYEVDKILCYSNKIEVFVKGELRFVYPRDNMSITIKPKEKNEQES